MKITSYYDAFLRKYQELAKAKAWKQPLLGMYDFSYQKLLKGLVFSFQGFCQSLEMTASGIAVALSYSLQIMDEGIIPVTPTDIPVDALVSPTGVIPISQAALDR